MSIYSNQNYKGAVLKCVVDVLGTVFNKEWLILGLSMEAKGESSTSSLIQQLPSVVNLNTDYT